MAFCINCGQELQDAAKFCAVCGRAVNDDNSTVKRKIFYDGEIYKCPNCGDIMDAFESVCKACGYERRGAKSTSSVRELQLKLERLYAKRSNKVIHTVFTHVLSGGQLSNVDQEIISLIKNFPIPNNKEDIIEFIILASSNIDLKVYGLYSQQYQIFNPSQREISDAWIAKYGQAYQKAEIMFGDSSEFISIKNAYHNKMKKINTLKHQFIWLFLGVFVSLILMFALVLVIISLTSSN